MQNPRKGCFIFNKNYYSINLEPDVNGQGHKIWLIQIWDHQVASLSNLFHLWPTLCYLNWFEFILIHALSYQDLVRYFHFRQVSTVQGHQASIRGSTNCFLCIHYVLHIMYCKKEKYVYCHTCHCIIYCFELYHIRFIISSRRLN